MTSELTIMHSSMIELMQSLSDCQVRSIGELSKEKILYVSDGNHGNDRPRRGEFVEEGVAFVRGRDIKGTKIDFDGCDRINDVAHKRIRKGHAKANDILYTHAGTIGKLVKVNNGVADFVVNPAVTVYRSLNTDIISQDFLYLYMHSKSFKDQVWSMLGETDIFDYISLTKQREILIPIPPIEVQNKITKSFDIINIMIEEKSKQIDFLIELNKSIIPKIMSGELSL